MFTGTEIGIEISVADATKKVKKFKNHGNNGTKKAHYFSRAILEKLLNDPTNVGIRVYSAMNDNADLDNFIVAVKKEGENVVSSGASSGVYASSLPCPDYCATKGTDFA